jgi:hypothetical protein
MYKINTNNFFLWHNSPIRALAASFLRALDDNKLGIHNR